MKAIVKYSKVYVHFWKLAFSQGIVYRVDSFLLFVGVALILVQNFVYFSAILNKLPSVGGWTLPEYSLLLATYSLNWGFFKIFYGRTMEEVINKIFTGQYDYYLLKPIKARFLSYTCPPNIKGVPTVLFNCIFVIYVISYFSIPINIYSVLLYAFYLLIGQIIVFSFSQAAVTTSFFTNDASDIYAIFENAWDGASYPGEAFNKNVFTILAFVIPVILFASFPTKILLGKTITPWEFIYPIIVAVICLFVSNTFYKFGIKKYTSAGG